MRMSLFVAVGREAFYYVLYTFTSCMCMNIKAKKSIDCVYVFQSKVANKCMIEESDRKSAFADF